MIRPGLAVLFSLLVAASASAQGPTLAVEDTLARPWITLPEYLVNAPRVRLDEILRLVAEGEARRDSLMQDQVFTLHVRIAYLDDDGRKAELQREISSRVYKKRPGRFRQIFLRDRGPRDEELNIRVGPEMTERFVSFAFEPRTRGQYEFEILERHLVGGHVVYVVAFTPKSRLEPLPTGKVWIDTNDFVIVREEFWYRDRSPAPMFIRKVNSCVIERTRVDGRFWVVSRLLARVELTPGTRFFGRLTGARLPQQIDFAVWETDWRINQGIPDSVFEESR